jgi:hypothetical protein
VPSTDAGHRGKDSSDASVAVHQQARPEDAYAAVGTATA